MGSTAPVAASWLAGFGVRFPGLGFCRWSGRPCACCPCALRAVCGFLPSGMFAFCLLLSGAPGLQSLFSFSSAQISLSLGSSCSSLSPMGLFLVGSGVCLCGLRSSCCPSPSFLWHTCWYPSVSVRLSYSSLFPTFLVGSSSSAFPGTLPAHSSGLSGALVGLPGSLLCLPPGYRSLSSQFPVV